MSLADVRTADAPCRCPTCHQTLPTSAASIFDDEAQVIVRHGRFACFTSLQWQIVRQLKDASPRLVSRQQLHTGIYWSGSEDEEAALRIIDVVVCHVRKELKPLGIEIQTAWGRGYRLMEKP